MTAAPIISAVERRSMLKSLGQRPGCEAVEQARQSIARIDDLLNANLRNIFCPCHHLEWMLPNVETFRWYFLPCKESKFMKRGNE